MGLIFSTCSDPKSEAVVQQAPVHKRRDPTMVSFDMERLGGVADALEAIKTSSTHVSAAYKEPVEHRGAKLEERRKIAFKP